MWNRIKADAARTIALPGFLCLTVRAGMFSEQLTSPLSGQRLGTPMPETVTSIEIELPTSTPLPNAEGANWFQLAQLGGTEVQLVVGTVNLFALHRLKGADAKVAPNVTHQFLLSPIGFWSLKKQLDEIAKHIAQPGVDVGLRAPT